MIKDIGFFGGNKRKRKMGYLITILIVITLIGKLDNIHFSILMIGFIIMSMLVTIDNKITKLSAGQKEKEEKR